MTLRGGRLWSRSATNRCPPKVSHHVQITFRNAEHGFRAA
jgi:hypothetical protein